MNTSKYAHSNGNKLSKKVLRAYCLANFKKFLTETTLHALKFLADRSLTIWEKSFFFCAFVAAFIITVNLISNVYAKWISTPVIIGISPHPTSILKTPLPAITLCNMNQMLLSKVSNYSYDSPEGALMKLLCYTETKLDERWAEGSNFINNKMKLSDFFINHGQPCSKMLLSCSIGAVPQNCSDLFHEILTDEGLCCVFNVLHPSLLYRRDVRMMKDYVRSDNSEPIDWNPESGYPKNMPEKYFPRPAAGTGVSMGVTLMLDAQLNEYFCSSTNGPGFKIGLHNSIETPAVKETAIVVQVGFETRLHIDVQSSEAMPTIRSLHRNERQCLFNDEENLRCYRHYSRRNCEMECQAKYLYHTCKCIPYNLPLLYNNVSVCDVREMFCVNGAEIKWMKGDDRECRSHCLPSCFDLSYQADAFSTPLAAYNYTTPNSILRNMSREYVNKNVAVLHFYYRESVFHGDLKNVYVGFTEFLSNTGGIMGLFMGFSFISVVEIIYFAFIRPIFELILPLQKQNQNQQQFHREL